MKTWVGFIVAGVIKSTYQRHLLVKEQSGGIVEEV
jgi:hypothetical protein